MLKIIYRLTRINETLGYVISLTLFGAILSNSSVNIRNILLIITANIFSVGFAYMINDVEDAEDDAKDPKKLKRNPISAKLINKNTGYLYSAIVAVLSIISYFLINFVVGFIGTTMIIIGFLYSWKKLRFKNLPLLDFLSHSYFLGSGLLLTSYLSFTSDIRFIIIPLIAAVLLSASGDLYNEIRDFKVDRMAGLKNTASILGVKATMIIRGIFSFVGISLIVYSVIKIKEQFYWPAVIVAAILLMGILLFNMILKRKQVHEFHKGLAYYPTYIIMILVLLMSLFFEF